MVLKSFIYINLQNDYDSISYLLIGIYYNIRLNEYPINSLNRIFDNFFLTRKKKQNEHAYKKYSILIETDKQLSKR